MSSMKDSPGGQDITELLGSMRRGNVQARDALFDRVYAEFRHLAGGRLRGERHETWAPTDLVQETCLRLLALDLRAEDRRQLFSLASTIMRRVLVDRARRRKSLKRAGLMDRDASPADLEAIAEPAAPSQELILDLDLAFDRLRQQHPDLAEVVTLRFHAGLSVEQTASVLEISTATVKRRWRLARAWLWREVSSRSEDSSA